MVLSVDAESRLPTASWEPRRRDRQGAAGNRGASRDWKGVNGPADARGRPTFPFRADMDPGWRAVPVYLRLSVTDACDFRCWYCRPEGTGPLPAAGPPLERRALGDLIRCLHAVTPLTKIRFTGGEPLFRSDLEAIVADLRAALPEAELALTTNGQRLAKRAVALRAAGLDRINVSLDSVHRRQFHAITSRDVLGEVLDGIRACQEAGFAPPKLNAVLLRSGAGTEIADLASFAASQGSELRFIELMPFGPAAGRFDSEFMPMAEALERLCAEGGYLGPLAPSGTSQRHLFLRPEGQVVVGFIPSVSEPFCHACDRLRLDARGRLYACLRQEEGLDLSSLTPGSLGSAWGADEGESRGTGFAQAVHDLLSRKGHPDHHWPARSLAGIGG